MKYILPLIFDKNSPSNQPPPTKTKNKKSSCQTTRRSPTTHSQVSISPLQKYLPSNTPQDEFELENSPFSSFDPFSDRFRLDDHPPLPYAGYEPSTTTTAPPTKGPLLPAPVITRHSRCACCRGRYFCGCNKTTAAIWGVFILFGMAGAIWGTIVMVQSGSLVKGPPPDVYSTPS
jgi:hypothetical protein